MTMISRSKFSVDEQRILEMIEDRLAKGQRQYGEWRVATDSKDRLNEALEEILDYAIYLAMQTLKLMDEGSMKKDKCSVCDTNVTKDDLQTCWGCGEPLCGECTYECVYCGATLCGDCQDDGCGMCPPCFRDDSPFEDAT